MANNTQGKPAGAGNADKSKKGDDDADRYAKEAISDEYIGDYWDWRKALRRLITGGVKR